MEQKQKDVQKEQLEVLKDVRAKLTEIASPPIWRSFLNGLILGFGTVIGATVLIAILIAVLQNFISIPVVGNWISQIIEVVQANLK